jgi:ATP-dependent DNA helicase RecQ
VAAPAPGREQQGNAALAAHVARIGKLPLLDAFTWSGSAPPSDTSSSPLVAHLESAVRLEPGVEVPRGPVLLCCTTMRTGWTATVCAALLHEAGATTTMPLVAHRLP